MGYDLSRLRVLYSMTEILDFLRTEYPKMDKPLLSKTMNEGYGVDLKPAALKSLAQNLDPEGWEKRREKDRHTLRSRVCCRLPDEEYAEFTARLKDNGYANVNEGVRTLILRYIEECKICEALIEEERIAREKQFWINFTTEEGEYL